MCQCNLHSLSCEIVAIPVQCSIVTLKTPPKEETISTTKQRYKSLGVIHDIDSQGTKYIDIQYKHSIVETNT